MKNVNFSEMSSTKNHSLVSFYIKVYYDAVLVLFTATPHITTTATHNGWKYLLHCQVKDNILPQYYIRYLVLLTRKSLMLEWNGRHRKLKTIVHFGHLRNVVKDFQKKIIVSSIPFRIWWYNMNVLFNRLLQIIT